MTKETPQTVGASPLSAGLGRLVRLIKDERDIEFIKAGTVITLNRRVGGDDPMWYGHCQINGICRYVLVFEDNLEPCETNSTQNSAGVT
jgi:hypothetical protein